MVFLSTCLSLSFFFLKKLIPRAFASSKSIMATVSGTGVFAYAIAFAGFYVLCSDTERVEKLITLLLSLGMQCCWVLLRSERQISGTSCAGSINGACAILGNIVFAVDC